MPPALASTATPCAMRLRHWWRQAPCTAAGGRGCLCNATPTEYALGRRVRFHQNVMASGRTPSRQILRLETCPASAREARLCACPGAAVHVIEGLSLADAAPIGDVPVGVSGAALSRAVAGDGAVAVGYRRLGRTGCGRLHPRTAPPSPQYRQTALLALHLRLKVGAPVLRSVAVNVDLAGVPVEFGTTWFAGDRVTLTVPGLA